MFDLYPTTSLYYVVYIDDTPTALIKTNHTVNKLQVVAGDKKAVSHFKGLEPDTDTKITICFQPIYVQIWHPVIGLWIGEITRQQKIRKTRHALTKEEKALIAEELKAGQSKQYLARKYDLSPRTVELIFARSNSNP